MTGIVKVFAGNYGIIEPHNAKKGDPDVFFHRSVMDEDIDRLTEGQWVQFDVIPDYVSKHGTQKATRVALCAPKRMRPEREAIA